MLADPVPLRVHWPRNADLRMNNMMYKPYSRGPNAKLGVNSRDDMASVGIMVTPVRPQASYLLELMRPRNPDLKLLCATAVAFSKVLGRARVCSMERL